MVAARGKGYAAVHLEEVAGKKKLIPADHAWVKSAWRVETSFGDD